MDRQHQHQLGVNKLGRNIRKSPLHQPNFPRLPPAALNQQQQALPTQPRVYKVSISDFRRFVQQETGPARDASGAGYPPAPAQPPQQKPPSSRLMKIRPPPLTPITPPPHFQNQIPNPYYNLNPNPAYHRPAPSPSAPGSAAWTDSPVSAYMRYLESTLLTSDTYRQPQPQPQPQPRSQGLLPFPHPAATSAGAFPSPRGMITSSSQPPSQPALLPSPGLPPGASFPLTSPNSQSPLPSPSSFLNLISPRSHYPLLSPRSQYPTPLTPNFFYSPSPQSGILGPGPGFQTLPPPAPLFPRPSGSRPLLSPRCREM